MFQSINKISSLTTFIKPINSSYNVKNVAKLFLKQKYSEFLSLPIVDDNNDILGIISRSQLFGMYLKPYGYEIYGKESIVKLMNSNPLVIDSQQSLEDASNYITENMSFPITEDFVILKDGLYFGVGKVTDLLRAITENKFQEYDHALAQKVVELEMRALELSSAIKSAQTANNTKNRFLANMSHELRTPLNAIIGYSEILSEDMDLDGNNSYLDDVQNILKSGNHLLNIVSEVLDISKIEADRMEIHCDDFALDKLINDIVAIIYPMITKNNNKLEVNYTVHGSNTMYSDEKKIRQCLLNLLSNATKFTQDDTIILNITNDLKSEWLHFTVEDHGIGITSTKQKDIFQPFVQIDNSSTRKYDGSGLGLTITNHFCQLLGGEISVTSKENEQTIFAMILPRNIKVST